MALFKHSLACINDASSAQNELGIRNVNLISLMIYSIRLISVTYMNSGKLMRVCGFRYSDDRLRLPFCVSCRTSSPLLTVTTSQCLFYWTLSTAFNTVDHDILSEHIASMVTSCIGWPHARHWSQWMRPSWTQLLKNITAGVCMASLKVPCWGRYCF
jgi:hypothetical protein